MFASALPPAPRQPPSVALSHLDAYRSVGVGLKYLLELPGVHSEQASGDWLRQSHPQNCRTVFNLDDELSCIKREEEPLHGVCCDSLSGVYRVEVKQSNSRREHRRLCLNKRRGQSNSRHQHRRFRQNKRRGQSNSRHKHRSFRRNKRRRQSMLQSFCVKDPSCEYAATYSPAQTVRHDTLALFLFATDRASRCL